eukprot:jgi/Chlat1/2873/Chrsp195S03018
MQPPQYGPPSPGQQGGGVPPSVRPPPPGPPPGYGVPPQAGAQPLQQQPPGGYGPPPGAPGGSPAYGPPGGLQQGGAGRGGPPPGGPPGGLPPGARPGMGMPQQQMSSQPGPRPSTPTMPMMRPPMGPGGPTPPMPPGQPGQAPYGPRPGGLPPGTPPAVASQAPYMGPPPGLRPVQTGLPGQQPGPQPSSSYPAAAYPGPGGAGAAGGVPPQLRPPSAGAGLPTYAGGQPQLQQPPPPMMRPPGPGPTVPPPSMPPMGPAGARPSTTPRVQTPPFGALQPPPFSSRPASSAPPSAYAPAATAGPPPPGMYAPSAQGYGMPPPVGPGDYAGMGAAAVAERFQSLSMGTGPAPSDGPADPNYFPRPIDSPNMPPQTGVMNCDPKYIRLACNAVPNSNTLRNRWPLPLGAVCHPLAESPGDEVPIVNFGTSGIVRCRRCRTYINPYVQFTDGGRRWRCNVCGLLNDVPVDYFCTLDADGRRRDVAERPELCKGSVEFIAPQEYMVRAPMPPVYFFIIDVSYPAVASGMVAVAAAAIKSCLERLPGDSRTRIGFLTFDSTLHFYNLKSSLSQPQMMVVAELEDVFLPLPDDLLVNLRESWDVVNSLLDSLPAIVANTQNVESALGPALQAAFMVVSPIGGKMLVFQSSLPTLGVGRLTVRGDDPRVYGTDREQNLRVAEDASYKKLAAECSRVQICVDVFSFCSPFADLGSLSTLPRYTGGQMSCYPGFTVQRDGEKFHMELVRNLTRVTGWEAVMRIRCGKGLKISSFHGHFFIRSSDLLALPAVDCDKAFVVQIAHDEALVTSPTVYFQCALLYTSSSGERRIRVHTLQIPVVADLGEMFNATDCGALAVTLSRLAAERTFTGKLEEARKDAQSKCVAALREYRTLYAGQFRSAPNRLVFPDTMRLLSIFTLGLIKNPALRGGFKEVHIDERTSWIFDMLALPADITLIALYPRLYSLHDMPPQCGIAGADGSMVLPPVVPLAQERLDPRGVYLMDDTRRLLLWLGREARQDVAISLLGNEWATPGIDLSLFTLPRLENDLSKRVNAIIAAVRKGRSLWQQVHVLRQGTQQELLLLESLVEDRNSSGPGYAEFLSQVHRQCLQKG